MVIMLLVAMEIKVIKAYHQGHLQQGTQLILFILRRFGVDHAPLVRKNAVTSH